MIKPASDVVMDTATPKRLGDPVLNLTPEIDRRRGRDSDAEVRFLHHNEAADSDEALETCRKVAMGSAW